MMIASVMTEVATSSQMGQPAAWMMSSKIDSFVIGGTGRQTPILS
jgi:hypothetical protein